MYVLYIFHNFLYKFHNRYDVILAKLVQEIFGANLEQQWQQ